MVKLNLAKKKGKILLKDGSNIWEERHKAETKSAMGCLDVYSGIHEKNLTQRWSISIRRQRTLRM